MKSVSAALIGCLSLVLAEPVMAQTQTAPDSVTRDQAPAVDQTELTALASRVLAHSDELARLWPGYWPRGQAFILYAPEVGAVFGGAAAPDGLTFKPGRLPGVNGAYEIDYPSSAPNTILSVVDKRGDDLNTLFHEQFHDFQTESFVARVGAGEFVDLTLIPDLEAFTAGAELERRVLGAALEADDPQARLSLSQTYTTMRRDRLKSIDGAIAATEDARERSEGTADYVALQASAVVFADGATNPRAALLQTLKEPLLNRPDNYSTQMFRWRAYGVGAAQAWLLDTYSAPDWRKQVEAGQSLTALLEKAVGFASPAEAAQISASFDPAKIRAEVRDQLLRRQEPFTDRASFLAHSPKRLTVRLTLPFSRVREVNVSFQSPGMKALSAATIALPDAEPFSAVGPAFTLNATGHWVLVDNPSRVIDGRGQFTFTVLLETFDGLGALGTGLTEQPLRIDADGLLLELPVGTTIRRSENEILIEARLEPKTD